MHQGPSLDQIGGAICLEGQEALPSGLLPAIQEVWRQGHGLAKQTKKQGLTMQSVELYAKLVEDLEEFCIDVFVHCENDFEITLSGNGTNSAEAANAAYAILDLLHEDGRAWRRANEKRINAYAKKLRKELGS